MARKTNPNPPGEGVDPVGQIPADGYWYPAEIRPGQWQGHRKWIERDDGAQHPCHCSENDIEDERNVRFETAEECGTRCDTLNQKLRGISAK
jgi:hypothetical protein